MAELDGRLEKGEDTPYGTHVLIEQQGTRFALRSEKLSLMGALVAEVLRNIE